MSLSFPRRFDRWHEQILLSRFFMILSGWLLTVVIPYIAFWSMDALLHPDDGQKTALVVTSAAYFVTHLSILKIRTLYPGGRAAGFIGPTIFVVYGLLAIATFMFHLSVSRYLLLSSSTCALIWMYSHYLLTYKYMRLKLAVVSGGKYSDEILMMSVVDSHALSVLSLGGARYDGVVADFESIDMPTQRFLAECALNRTAVYDAKDIYESLTGRVKIHRMSENNMGSLLPSPVYEVIKRSMDLSIVLISAPFTLVLGAVTAVLIKIESPGPVIYKQTRIGQGNKPFVIYKFRSMRFDLNAEDWAAEKDDPRITRVGKIIRKYRIDEFPQFINVLKGEMSLIGPRPEHHSFVDEYEKNIPFYSYRHIVKPGITGWAQVRHGYTAHVDEVKVKIEHDFYYIKNCSFSLDVIIVLMTIRIMLNGFGAR